MPQDMPSDTAKEIIRLQEHRKTGRTNFERQWHEIALRVLPRYDDFLTKRTPGARRDQYIFDSTAPLALNSFAAAMESLLTPRTQKWHNIAPADPALKTNKRVMLYLQNVRDILFRVRYSAHANFASQINEAYMSLGAFGTCGLYTEDAYDKGICYQHIPLAELYISENAQGIVDTVDRRYEFSARNAYSRWGEQLPEKIRVAAEREPDRRFEFIHAVRPNNDRKHDSKTHRGMAIEAFDVCIEGSLLLASGGFRTMPYAVSRYVTANREMYGCSPAQDSLADIMTLNEMGKTALRYGQLVSDPPWLTADVDSLEPFSVRPGSINAGYLNERGEVLAKSLVPEGDPKFGLDIQNQKREAINRSFLVTLFQILVDTPEMTATEVMERAQEKGALLAPAMGRQQSELLGPIIEREIDILAHAGVLPPPPPELAQSGGHIDIVYDSPLTRAQRADEGVGIMRTLEVAGQLAQFDKTGRVLRKINTDRTLEILSQINGAPADMLFDDAEMAQQDQAAAQQQQLTNLAQMAPAVTQSIKNVAQANQASTQAPF